MAQAPINPHAPAPPLPMAALLPPLALLLACLLVLPLISQGPMRPADPALAGLWSRVSASLAWLAGAWLLIRLIEVLVWERLMPRRGSVRIPRLLRQLVAVVLMSITLAVMLSQVWDVSVVAVLATTGAIGIVIGLALRNILADFFSGIALNLEQPFRLDDFVLLHVRGKSGPVAGMVREVNWRSTRVLTPEDNLVIVPNSAVSEATVENLSFPSPVYEHEQEILLDWSLDPARVGAVLGAALMEAWVQGATSGDKPPLFRISRLDGAGVAYKIIYLIDPRKKPRGPARHALLSCVHKHLRFAGLRPVPGLDASSAVPTPQQHPVDFAQVEDRLLAIGQISLLAVLTPDERHALAGAVQVRRFDTAGQAVVRSGEAGHSMFIVAAGVLEVLLPAVNGQAPLRATTLAPGDFFGEMSMLTGAPRTATVQTLYPSVLYEVPHTVMADLLAARPMLAEGLSRVVADHHRSDAAASSSAGAEATGPQRRVGLAESIAARIRAFLGH